MYLKLGFELRQLQPLPLHPVENGCTGRTYRVSRRSRVALVAIADRCRFT